jgi:uncharacterized damage-inducible protein DinB
LRDGKDHRNLKFGNAVPSTASTPFLQPVAHALLQAVEDVEKEISTFPQELLWEKPGGVASVGFHLKHLKGVIDRLFTYAQGEMLSDAQTQDLREEQADGAADSIFVLVNNFKNEVATAIDQLKNTDVNTLAEKRGVGRKQIPSTVIGLLFHSAEHIQRHVGQLIVTARVLKASRR